MTKTIVKWSGDANLQCNVLCLVARHDNCDMNVLQWEMISVWNIMQLFPIILILQNTSIVHDLVSIPVSIWLLPSSVCHLLGIADDVRTHLTFHTMVLDDGNLPIFKFIIIWWDVNKHSKFVRGFVTCEVNDLLTTDNTMRLFSDIPCPHNNLVVALWSQFLVDELYESLSLFTPCSFIKTVEQVENSPVAWLKAFSTGLGGFPVVQTIWRVIVSAA